MLCCAHCPEDCCIVHDHDKGLVISCCTGCGRVLDRDDFPDEPAFVIDDFEEQAAKQAACEVGSNGEVVVKPKKKRKQRSSEEEENSAPAETTPKATRRMLKKKTFSSRVNYEALESLYTTEQGKVEKQEDKLETGDADRSDQGSVEDGDEAGTSDGGDSEEVGYDTEYDPFGDEDESYPYEEIELAQAFTLTYPLFRG